MSNKAITLDALEKFITKAENFEGLNPTKQIEYFVYFLTVESKLLVTNATEIRECFLKLQLLPYSNISAYLSNNLKGRNGEPPKFLRNGLGYLLHRISQDKLRQSLKENEHKAKVSQDLRGLLRMVKNVNENEFLNEAINCFEISAYRASIVMVWNLTLDHLYEFILKHQLTAFNSGLLKNTDKRIKITSVSNKDDFNEIPEGKFIEFSRSGNIVSNDVRKILETKLGIRNTYAHPSNVKIVESKALEFIEDLVTNVVLKYPL